MLCVFTWISFLIFLPGVFSENSTTCVPPNLFDEFKDKFGKKDFTLKQIGDNYLKCLAMYDRDPRLVLNSSTMKNIVGNVDTLAEMIVHQITGGDHLDHSDLFEAFEETCFYNNFGKQLGSFFRSNYKMKLTCPLGLLWDIICTFTSCLQSDCKVDGETCPSEQDSKESCRTSINLKLYCKRNFERFLDSCVFDTNQHKILMKNSLNDVLHDTDCSDFNYIYQGLISLQGVEEGVIAAICYGPKEAYYNVSLKCFNNGTYVDKAVWYLDDTKDPSGSKGTLSISRGDLLRYSKVSCYEDSVKVAEIGSKHTHQLCYPGEEEEGNAISTDTRNGATPSPSPEQDTTSPALTTTSGSISGTGSDINRKKWKNLYTDSDIWLFEESDGSLDGIDAFDNNKTLRTNVDKLTVALVCVMGRLTPICGELWNKGTAEVFCRDAGAQLQQNWTASFVGAVHKSKNERHENNKFYKHYLRNITCKGDESNIIWCDHDGWYHHSACTHDAVVICSEVKVKDESNQPAGLEIVIIAICVIAGVSLFGISIIFIVRRLPGCKCYHQLGRRESHDSEINTVSVQPPSEVRGTEMKGVTCHIPSESDSGNFSDFNFGDSSAVIAGGPVSYATHNINNLIQEHDLKRLNCSTAPQWVLLCKMEGKTLVCKSFENVAWETEDDMRTEQFFLSHVKHPNVVKCVGEPREISFINERKHSFFMEHLEFGGLDSYLRDKDERTGSNHGHLMTVEDATNIIIGICRALHFVHNLGYVHADISTDNFFAFKNDETGLLDVKLGDFESFYRPATDDVCRSGRPLRFTALYTAPEFILKDPIDERGNRIKKDAFKNDVWGLALVLWEVQSWIMCKNSKSSFKSEEQSRVPTTAQSSRALISNMVSRSMFVVSRIMYAHDYTCRRHVHVALFQKINNLNPKAETNRPERSLMEEFYRQIHPRNMGYPAMDPNLDKKFGWPITNLLKKCLAINPTNRLSMKEILEYLLEHANENPGSPLSTYKSVLELDLNMGDNVKLTLEDIDSVESCEMFQPPALQQNLGQLYQRF